MEKDEFQVKAYSNKELANHYKVSTKTFSKWVTRLKANIGPRIGHFYNPQQVKIITDTLGKPFSWLGILAAKVFANFFDHDDPDGGPWSGGEGKMLK